ncbi:uncharacterized protein LOC117340543 [Pecten maximus]|uniref:uncharacterized protein LOC117340543 n=1 Tax=Pecten maximus TaxID=6579 RepID=UPI0014585BBD|nr:uncharacterized protein LOC117340543 [Pecten maximus]
MDSDNYFVPESLKAGLQETQSAFFFPVLAPLTTKAKTCFMKEGPQGYDFGEAFPEVVDAMDERMSLNADMVVEQLLLPVTEFKESLRTILDLGSGAGCVSRAISRRYPDADIYAVDYSEIAIEKAIETSEVQGITNITFLKEDLTSLPKEWTGKFDWVIMYDVLHDLPDHSNAMKEVM